MKDFRGRIVEEIEIDVALPIFTISGFKFRVFFDVEKDELVYIPKDDDSKWLSPKDLKIFIRKQKLEKISKL